MPCPEWTWIVEGGKNNTNDRGRQHAGQLRTRGGERHRREKHVGNKAKNRLTPFMCWGDGRMNDPPRNGRVRRRRKEIHAQCRREANHAEPQSNVSCTVEGNAGVTHATPKRGKETKAEGTALTPLPHTPQTKPPPPNTPPPHPNHHSPMVPRAAPPHPHPPHVVQPPQEKWGQSAELPLGK